MQKFHREIISEILEEKVPKRLGRSNPRAVKKKMSKFPVRIPLGKTRMRNHIIKVRMFK